MIIKPNKIIEDCLARSKKLLIKNSSQYGVMASTPTAKAKKKLYSNIFGRDASICALGMIASQDKKLVEIAKTSLLSLAKHQTDLGEIPSSFNPVTGQKSFYFLGSIDSNLWWLLALDFYHQHSGDKDLKIKLLPQIKKALLWLRYQDQNNDGLLEEGEACNWSDDMPVNGRTLYSNVLWFEVLKRYGFTRQAELAEGGINILFLPHSTVSKNSEFIMRDPHHRKLELKILKESVASVPYYLHYISYKHVSDRLDVYGNSLAILFSLPRKAQADSIVREMRKAKVSRKYPVSVLTPPIKPRDFDWRPNMDREECANKPFGYHNGGIWPYVGCFYVMALHKLGRKDLAWREFKRVAEANKQNNWEFNEWFHGKTGEAMGMAGQSWNAGTFLLAYHVMKGDVEF